MKCNKSVGEIRKNKLLNIQQTSNKLKKITTAYEKIKQKNILNLTKNIGSNFFRIIIIIFTIISFITTVICFFKPIYITKYCKYILVFFTLILYLFSVNIKINKKKRNSIYELSKLLKELISYMESILKEDKKRYDNFIKNTPRHEDIKQEKTFLNKNE